MRTPTSPAPTTCIGRAQHQQQADPEQRPHRHAAAAARAAEGLDEAERDGGDGGADENVNVLCKLLDPLLERGHGSLLVDVRRAVKLLAPRRFPSGPNTSTV